MRQLSVQYYDCLLLNSIWYCRRPTDDNNWRTNTDDICHEEDQRAFSDLAATNIMPEQLLDWLVSVDIAQRYANYLRMNSSTNELICNCSYHTFGVHCEYQSPDLTRTSLDILTEQLTNVRSASFVDQWCLIDVPCHMGLGCLDWRYVCDGIEQCQFGEDEFDCERLEENECEPNEYRCRNGMCIPDEWFFDAMFDCQDESDEHKLNNQIKIRQTCRLNSYDPICAEHFCSSQQSYSCGDGQCLHWQNLYDEQDECVNNQHLFHQCEFKIGRKLVTLEKYYGSCEVLGKYEPGLTNDSLCVRAFRKLLYGGRHIVESFNESCEETFNFPVQSPISFNIYVRYKKNDILSAVK